MIGQDENITKLSINLYILFVFFLAIAFSLNGCSWIRQERTKVQASLSNRNVRRPEDELHSIRKSWKLNSLFNKKLSQDLRITLSIIKISLEVDLIAKNIASLTCVVGGVRVREGFLAPAPNHTMKEQSHERNPACFKRATSPRFFFICKISLKSCKEFLFLNSCSNLANRCER